MDVHVVQKINPDLTAVNAARVSYLNSSHELNEADERLLSFLKKNHHKSPFWHYEVVKEIKTTYMTMYHHFREPWIVTVKPDKDQNIFYVKNSVWGWSDIIQKAESDDSFPSHVLDDIKDEKNVVKVLDKHPHADKLSSVTLYIENVPIPIREQLLKHRLGLGVYFYDESEFPRSELSRRFTSKGLSFLMPDVFYKQSENNKQAGEEIVEKNALAKLYLEEAYEDGLDAYWLMINLGVSREQARFALPQGMESSWYYTGNVDAFSRMVALRKYNLTGPSQTESQILASMIEDEVEAIYPNTWAQCMDKWHKHYSN